MSRSTPDALRRLAAELLHECERLDRTVAEAAIGQAALLDPAPERLRLYGAAALLDTFYTGVEKALSRIAQGLDGGLPQGPAWHRQLLEDMSIEIPEARPAVLTSASCRALDGYLSFRHRFRNLYLFDLEAAPMRHLLDALPPTWAKVRSDLVTFAGWLRLLAAPA